MQSMQTPLQKLTDQTYQNIQNLQLTLRDMPQEHLSKYLTGLRLHKSQLTNHIQDVKQEIKRKERTKEHTKKKAPTTAEKATNWWSAMGIIFICFSAIITGGAYSISQILQIQTEWIKLVLIIAVLGVGLLMFLAICICIWPRRDINKFEQLLEIQEN